MASSKTPKETKAVAAKKSKRSTAEAVAPELAEESKEIAEAITDTMPIETPLADPIELPASIQAQTPSAKKQAEDRALVRRAREGDNRAFAELIQRHRHGIERMIRPLVRSAPTDEVEDLVQEALTKAFMHIHSYSEEYAFTTWLYRIATNHAIDYLRRRKLNAFSISAPPTQVTSRGDEEGREYEISDSSWIPEDMMLSEERSRIIAEAIEELPENYRRVIKLRHSDDLEYEEIAKQLNIPMGTVKVHLHRARAALAKILEGKI